MASPLILGRRVAAARGVGFAQKPVVGGGEVIRYAGDGHLITIAPTGAGKSCGPVICNALTHPGQLIVLDIKGEIHAATAERRRAMGQKIHVLDLRDNGIAGSLNPLDLAGLSGDDVAAAGRGLAAEIVERSDSAREKFWDDQSESLIMALAAWMLKDCAVKDRRMSRAYDLLSGDPAYEFALMLDGANGRKVTNKAARAAFCGFLQLPEKETRPCVATTVLGHLRLFDSDLARRLTDTTSIDLLGLIAGDPMSIYIIVPPLRLNAYRPLLRLWLTGLILAITQRECAPEHRTLMLCDEAGNLGRMDALFTAATLMRSWGLTLWTFWQNLAQLNIYGGQAHTLVDNAGVVQVFGARNFRMAQDIANLIGGVSAEQIMAMRPDEQILLIEGKLMRCKQARYYSDELFKGM